MGKLPLVAAGVLVALTLLLVFLVRREPGRGERGAVLAVPPDTPGQPGPSLSDPGVAELATSAADGRLGSTRESRSDALPRGILRGRLVEAEGGAPFRGARIVLLASPRDEVAETLRSRADGSFTSEREFPRGAVRAWVKDPVTRATLVRHEAEFDPHAAGEWLVPVPPVPLPVVEASAAAREDGEGVTLHGFVVDLAQEPVEGAQVKVFALGEAGALSCEESTSASGEFLVDELAAGAHRVLVQGRFVSSAPLDLVLAEGSNDAGAILLPAESVAGVLRGRLVAEEGAEDPFGVIVLRDLASGKELAKTADLALFVAREQDGVTGFEIADVPQGEYELAVVAFDGREYEPAALRVSPPAEGLEFRARAGRPRYFGLRVRDGTTGAEIDDAVVAGRIRGQWLPGDEEDFPPGCERWLVCAEGFRPARGDFSGARPVAGDGNDEIERLQVEVALEPGHGLAVLFKDVESDRLLAPQFEDLLGPGVEGVTVLEDGKPVGRSDADGLALLDLPRAPASLSYARPGWRVVRERRVEGVLYVHMARE